MNALEVIASGPFATVQDLGRPGFAVLGVGASGAADRGSLRLANRLVGNPEGAAAVEATYGGLVVRARGALTLAAAGAACPPPAGAAALPSGAVVELSAGAVAGLGPPAVGLRTYVAVRGGIAVEAVLGSRARDVLGGIGPPPLTSGDVLAVGDPPAPPWQPVDVAPGPAPRTGPALLRVVLGPRDEWFTAGSLRRLVGADYVVGGRCDRVGMRLEGPPLRRVDTRELDSEGMVRGCLQVPPDGRPVLLLADAPVTGGYPVVAVVVDADVDRAAQLRPGDRLRFTATSVPA